MAGFEAGAAWEVGVGVVSDDDDDDVKGLDAELLSLAIDGVFLGVILFSKPEFLTAAKLGREKDFLSPCRTVMVLDLGNLPPIFCESYGFTPWSPLTPRGVTFSSSSTGLVRATNVYLEGCFRSDLVERDKSAGRLLKVPFDPLVDCM